MGVEAELIQHGVSASQARRFSKDYPLDYLQQKLDEFPFREVKKNAGGLLAASIRENYPTPPGYQSPGEIKEAAQSAKRKEVAALERRKKEEALNQLKDEAARQFLDQLSPEQLAALRRQATQRCPGRNPSERVREAMLIVLAKELLEEEGNLPMKTL